MSLSIPLKQEGSDTAKKPIRRSKVATKKKKQQQPVDTKKRKIRLLWQTPLKHRRSFYKDKKNQEN